MRVLLTGASGRLGGPVLKALHRAGHEIRTLGRGGLPAPLTPLVQEHARGDILVHRDWRHALDDMDAVVHLAGITSNNHRVFEENVTAARIMTRACAEAEVDRILFASSHAVLGHWDRPASKPFLFGGFPIDEETPLRCESDHGLSKAVSEQVLGAAARRWGLQVFSLRMARVWDDEMCEHRARNGFFEPSHATELWAWIHANDCARAFVLALEQEFVSGEFHASYLSAADTLADTPSQTLVETYFPAMRRTCKLKGHQSFFSWQAALDRFGFIPTHSWRAPQTLEGGTWEEEEEDMIEIASSNFSEEDFAEENFASANFASADFSEESLEDALVEAMAPPEELVLA